MLRYKIVKEDLVLLTDGKRNYQLPIDFDSFKELMTNREFFWLIPLGGEIKELNDMVFGETDQQAG